MEYSPKLPYFPKTSDPKCSRGLDDLGQVRVHLAKSKTEKDQLELELDPKGRNLKGVKANPLSSQFLEKILINRHERTVKKGCVKRQNSKIIDCESFETKVLNEGEELHLCKREYDEESLENYALASIVSIQKSLECIAPYFPDGTFIPKITLYLFPRKEILFHMKDGTQEKSYETNNAYFSSKQNQAKGYSDYTIAALPHTKEFMEKTARDGKKKNRDFIRNLGVLSHETFHFVFQLFTPGMRSLTNHQSGLRTTRPYLESSHQKQYSPEREVNGRMVVGVINEAKADEGEHLCFNEDPYADTRLTGSENTRDPDIGTIPSYDNKKGPIKKAITIDVSRHLFSEKDTKQPHDSHNDKDIHHVAAFYLYGKYKFYRAMGLRLPSQRAYHPEEDKDTTDEQYKDFLDKSKRMALQGIINMGQVIPDKNPMVLLDQLIFEDLRPVMHKDPKTGALSVPDKACDVLKEYLPVNLIGMQNKFKCGG